MNVKNSNINQLFADYHERKKELEKAKDFGNKPLCEILEAKLSGIKQAIDTLGLQLVYKQWVIKEGLYTICSENVRQFCINHQLYTMGYGEDYERLLKCIDNQLLPIRDIAQSIYDNSRFLSMTAKELEILLIDEIVKGV